MLPHIANQGLIAYAMMHLPGSFLSVGLLVQTVVATVVAWVLLAKTLSVLQAFGTTIVLGRNTLCPIAQITGCILMPSRDDRSLLFSRGRFIP